MGKLIINAKRNGYSPDQCGRTLTVEDLISFLEGFDGNMPVYLSHDSGYTYGSITEQDFEDTSEDDE